jgi:hypothetical protein
VGILQAILQAMLRGAGPVGYCLKVLEGIISAGYCARYLVGVLFLDPRSLILYLLLVGRFVPRSLILYLLLVGRFVPRSWILYLLLASVLFLAPGVFVPGFSFRSWHCGFVDITGSWALLAPRHCGFVGIAGSWALLAPKRYRSWKT